MGLFTNLTPLIPLSLGSRSAVLISYGCNSEYGFHFNSIRKYNQMHLKLVEKLSSCCWKVYDIDSIFIFKASYLQDCLMRLIHNFYHTAILIFGVSCHRLQLAFACLLVRHNSDFRSSWSPDCGNTYYENYSQKEAQVLISSRGSRVNLKEV